jgi:hypothetical protein
LGEEEKGIHLTLQTPQIVEIHPGQSKRSTVLVLNKTEEKKTVQPIVTIAEGFTCFSEENHSITLEKEEMSLQIIAFVSSKNIPAGDYPLTYRIEEEEVRVVLRVPEVRDLKCEIVSYPKNVFASDVYPIRCVVRNLGNSVEEVELVANSEVFFHSSRFFTLKPQETKEIEIDVYTPKESKLYCHMALITCKALNKEPFLFAKAQCLTHIYPKVTDKFYPYLTIPSVLSVGGTTCGNRAEAYFEVQGDGYLDEAKSKRLSYYGCTGGFNDFNFLQNCDRFLETLNITYRDPKKEIYLARGPFTLTPLTMRGVYGVGGSVKTFSKKLQGGFLFLNTLNCREELLGGGYLSCFLFPWWTLSTQAVKVFDRRIEFYEDSNQPLITSLSTNMASKNCQVFGEIGKNWENHRQAYSIGAQGVTRQISYSFLKEVCPRSYQIYFNGGESLKMTTSFPLFNCFRGNISYFGARNYPNWNALGAYRENKLFSAVLTCPPKFWVTNFTYQHQVLSDSCFGICQVSDVGSCGVSGFLKCVHYFLGSTVGRYKNGHCCVGSPLWYQLNGTLSCSLNRCWQAAFNMTVGPFNSGYCECWKKRAGFRLGWRGQSQFRFDACLNHFWFNRLNQVTTGHLMTAYFFRNGHTFELDGMVKYIPNCNYEYFTRFNYSIPWNLIARRKSSKSSLKGSVLDEKGAPMPYQQIYCGPQKTLTDKKGQFVFPNIDAGEHTLFLNPDREGLMLANREDLFQNLEGGYEKSISLRMVPSCSLRGRVTLFGFEEVGESIEEKIFSKKGFNSKGVCKEIKPIEGVAVYVHSKSRKETYRELTNRDGEFSFSQLFPGEWEIEVEYSQLPPYHELILEEKSVRLKANETYDLRIKVQPKELKILIL